MVLPKQIPDKRRFSRYKLYLFVGICIFAFQIFLAIRFFSISGEDTVQNVWNPHKLDGNLPESADIENSVDNAKKPILLVDDEDTVIKKKSPSKQIPAIPRLRVEELDFTPDCDITGKEAISAIHRAKTQHCKRQIANITCLIKEERFYPKELPNSCPSKGVKIARSLGCYKDEKNYRLLNGFYGNNKLTNSPEYCIGLCLQSGFPYAGVQYSTECFCGNDEPAPVAKLPDSSCNMKCPANPQQICGGYFTMNIFETGINTFSPQIATTSISKNKPVKIVFLLTLNGRALRQVKRLIKILFHVDHYFYIHVDIRQDYLYRELLSLERQFPNIRLTRKRFATIWGGASLLTMLLSTMSELLHSNWEWDFVLNLSESDYPVKPLSRLVEFLSANAKMNFVKSHGREVQRFIQKQGLDKTFVECDTHMWRIGDRKLPYGIQIDGGSDWIALSKDFVGYVTAESTKLNDQLISGLLIIFNHTLLPAESFFHTALRNSKFCGTYVDNNLHVTNWKRKLGCKCQYKHVVDWCGCSPNDFTPDDWLRIQNTEARQLFFARKFEPIINQAVVLQLEQWLTGRNDSSNLVNVHSYWQNIFHHQDLGIMTDDALQTLAYSSVRSLLKQLLSGQICGIYDEVKVLEITSYHSYDFYKSTLIKFTYNVNIDTVELELGVKPKNRLLLTKSSSITKRLKYLLVSSDYDQKEQLSRNFLRVLGPYSSPVLVYNFSATLDKTSNVTFLWVDPAGRLSDISELYLDEGPLVGHIKSNLKQPLIPGAWKLILAHKFDSLAEMDFLITPLTFYSGNIVTFNQVDFIHSGNSDVKLEHVLSQSYDKFLPNSFDSERLEQLVRSNAKRFGSDLNDWVDSLFGKFYEIVNLCGVNGNAVCGRKVDSCRETLWSSMAPDLKSFIGTINLTSGTFDLW